MADLAKEWGQVMASFIFVPVFQILRIPKLLLFSLRWAEGQHISTLLFCLDPSFFKFTFSLFGFS